MRLAHSTRRSSRSDSADGFADGDLVGADFLAEGGEVVQLAPVGDQVRCFQPAAVHELHGVPPLVDGEGGIVGVPGPGDLQLLPEDVLRRYCGWP